MARHNSIGTITFANRPDPWKLHQAWADLVGRQCGYKITVTSVRYKDTGEEVQKREAAPVTPSDRHEVIVHRV